MGILQVVYSIEIIDFRCARKQRVSPSPVDAAVGLPASVAHIRLENIPIYAVFAEISFSRERRDFFLIDRKVSGGNNETPYLLPEDTC